MSVAKLIIGDDSEGNIEKGGEKTTVKVVRKDTGETLMVLEGEKLTDDTMRLIDEKGIEVDGDIRYFNPVTMKLVEVKDVICNKVDDCVNQECEHRGGHIEHNMTDPCDATGCGIFKDAKCVPVSSTVNVPKVRSETEEEVEFQVVKEDGITGPCVPPEVKHSVLEGLLQDYYEGNDICDLDLKRMMSKEMQYNAIVRQMLAFLECHENDDVPNPDKLVYDAEELNVMIEMVEKALKELEGP